MTHIYTASPSDMRLNNYYISFKTVVALNRALPLIHNAKLSEVKCTPTVGQVYKVVDN